MTKYMALILHQQLLLKAKLATLEETVEDMDKRLKQYREENVMLKQKIASGTDLQTLM